MEKFTTSIMAAREKQALVLWGVILLAVTVAYTTLLPLREDFLEAAKTARFWIGTIAWLPAIFMSAYFCFNKQKMTIPPAILNMLLLFGPFLLVLIRMHEHADFENGYFSTHEIAGEMNLYQGRCGFIIMATAVLTSVLGFSVIRRVVFSNDMEVGTGALFSSGSFASFLMQFVCAHENPLHLFIWHFLPLMLLGTIVLALEKKIYARLRIERATPRQTGSLQGQFFYEK